MKLVGGPRHADEVELPEGATSYLDIRSADTYYVRKVQYVARDNETGEPATFYKAEVAVWERLLGGDQEMPLVMSYVMDMAARAWFVDHGAEAEMPGHLRAQQNGGNKLITTEETHDESGSTGTGTSV